MTQPEVSSYEVLARHAERLASAMTSHDPRDGDRARAAHLIAGSNRVIAYAILALAAATRPAPVDVRVEVDKDAIVAAVRETLGGDK